MLRPTLLVLLAFACAVAATAAVPTAALAHPQDSLADGDHDGVNDPPHPDNDNCAGENAAYNPNQKDTDLDGLGDACDTDDDEDSVDDAVDNCPLNANAAQADADGDAAGDVCDADDDGDGSTDSRDNCRFVPNQGQADADGDGLGDACDDSTPGGRTRPPGDPGGPPDVAAPEIRLPVATRHRTAELGAGLAVPVWCSERCTVSTTLTLSRRDARRLGLRGRVLGSGGAELDDQGETFVFVDLARRALRRLRARSVRATLRVEVADAAGNRRTLSRRLTIRR
ncbi:MAG TPA: thrombospondin type 3 repeat-containing protein [Solirubrobacteraceae bacterium]|nr:thrombospondin type 3 repeat-containing protein [Solirubrobacteraceae bacterium]